MSVGLFMREVEKEAMRFKYKLISIDPLLRHKAKIELSLAILISVCFLTIKTDITG